MEGDSAQTVITKDVEIKGTVKSAGSIRIDGKLEGDLICSGDATIGNGATVNGNLSVNSVTVSGSLNGNISAKDRIDMKSTAKVVGDIQSKRLAVEDGVTFVGKSEVNPSGSAAAPAPAPKVEAKDEAPKTQTFVKR